MIISFHKMMELTAPRSVGKACNDVFPVIAIVDDDQPIRDSISSLLRSAGYRSAVFPSAEAFLASGHFAEIDCLILDVSLPGISGLDLQRRLSENKSVIPIIFVTAHFDALGAAVREQRTVKWLSKPFNGEALLDAIESVLKVPFS